MSAHVWSHFSPFAEGTWRVMSFLTMGLEGKVAVSISASKHGLTLKIGGKPVARGKDTKALGDDFDRYMEEQHARVALLKVQLARLEARANQA